MAITIERRSVDAKDPDALARWWAEALQWEVTEEEPREVLVRPPDGDAAGSGLRELRFLRCSASCGPAPE